MIQNRFLVVRLVKHFLRTCAWVPGLLVLLFYGCGKPRDGAAEMVVAESDDLRTQGDDNGSMAMPRSRDSERRAPGSGRRQHAGAHPTGYVGEEEESIDRGLPRDGPDPLAEARPVWEGYGEGPIMVDDDMDQIERQIALAADVARDLVRVSALLRYPDGEVRVGLATDHEDRYDVLRIGDTFLDYTLVDIDETRGVAVLMKDGERFIVRLHGTRPRPDGAVSAPTPPAPVTPARTDGASSP